MCGAQHFSIKWDRRLIATLLNHIGKRVIFLVVEEGAKRYFVDPLAAFMQAFNGEPDALVCWIFEMVRTQGHVVDQVIVANDGGDDFATRPRI